VEVRQRGGLEVVVFDLDGVLVDSRGPIAACINDALEALGLVPEPDAALHGWIGHPLRDVFAALLAARGADPALVPELVAAYRERYRTVSIEQTRLFPGVAEAVHALAARLRLAIASSKPEAFSRPILEAVGLAGAFADVLGPPLDETHREDKTVTLGRALAALGVEGRRSGGPWRAAMVGDRRFDVAAAHAHGLAAVGVLWGIGDARELAAAGAHALVATPRDLVRWALGGAPEPERSPHDAQRGAAERSPSSGG
jgi:phosphoglycolate phosphatase